MSNIWRFIINTKESSHEADVIKTRLFELSKDTWSFSDFVKVKNMKTTYKFMFKILIACLIPIEGSTDQFFRDHRHFIWYLVNEENINLPGYIFNHLCEYIKDINKLKKNNVHYVRILYELFHQGRLIDYLKSSSAHDDLEEIHGNILSASVLDNMKLLNKNEMVLSKDPLRVRSVKIDYLKDYQVITKHDNPRVIRMYIEMAKEKVGVVLWYEYLPEEPIDAYKPFKKRK